MAVTQAQKRRIKQEAGFKCAVPTCTQTSPLEIHHIVHRHNGGTDEDENLICLCAGCHGRYHLNEITAQAITEYKQRLRRISLILAVHEYGFLEALFRGQSVELDNATLNLGGRLERNGLVTVTDLQNGQFRLNITPNGRAFIQ